MKCFIEFATSADISYSGYYNASKISRSYFEIMSWNRRIFETALWISPLEAINYLIMSSWKLTDYKFVSLYDNDMFDYTKILSSIWISYFSIKFIKEIYEKY